LFTLVQNVVFAAAAFSDQKVTGVGSKIDNCSSHLG
jgi:hypothetical protein